MLGRVTVRQELKLSRKEEVLGVLQMTVWGDHGNLCLSGCWDLKEINFYYTTVYIAGNYVANIKE